MIIIFSVLAIYYVAVTYAKKNELLYISRRKITCYACGTLTLFVYLLHSIEGLFYNYFFGGFLADFRNDT